MATRLENNFNANVWERVADLPKILTEHMPLSYRFFQYVLRQK
jgi:hypothetical protein